MVVQPGVEVNAVPDAAASQTYGRDAQAVEERDADAEILRGLVLGEAASGRAGECEVIHRH